MILNVFSTCVPAALADRHIFDVPTGPGIGSAVGALWFQLPESFSSPHAPLEPCPLQTDELQLLVSVCTETWQCTYTHPNFTYPNFSHI